MIQQLYGGVQFPQSGPNLDNVERIDRGAWPMTLHMMQHGMQVDLSHFARMERELTQDMEEITAQVHTMTGKWVNLDSGDQVSHLLFKELGIKQVRPKFTKGSDEKEARESVEEEVLLAVQHDHEVVPKILDYKELSKLRGTYVVPMPRLARRTRHGVWRLYPNLGTTRVPSGRYNCKAPNLLAMPTRTKRGRQIRLGFITDTGWVYLSCDFSQFEPRACAHCSEDPTLIAIYENAEDVYSDLAITAFAIPDNRYRDETGWHYPGVDKETQRFPSKTCFLAALYDVSAKGLLDQMPVICVTCGKPTSSDKEGTELHDPLLCDFVPLWTEDKCQDLLNRNYMRYPGILRDRKRHHNRARQFSYIWDLWGRMHHVAAVRSVHPWVVSGALREVGNFPYQGLNSGALKLAMAEIFDEFEGSGLLELAHPILPVHDELIFEVREDMAEEVGEYVRFVFENVVKLRVPVRAEWSKGDTWATSK